MKKALLLDVTILRPMAILLLVIFHAFIIYNGGWKAPLGYVDVEPYRLIADISYSFMLQLFVMLSGYVFGFQIYEQKRNFTSLKKVSRKLCAGILIIKLGWITSPVVSMKNTTKTCIKDVDNKSICKL